MADAGMTFAFDRTGAGRTTGTEACAAKQDAKAAFFSQQETKGIK
jgi:hypothetical protein